MEGNNNENSVLSNILHFMYLDEDYIDLDKLLSNIKEDEIIDFVEEID